MLFIYIPQVTSRVQYIFDFIFSSYLEWPYQLITSLDDCPENGHLIVYGKAVDNKLSLGAHTLLFETSIEQKDINVFEYEGHKAFFKVSHGPLPYDPFALSFYMLTRYEEYLPFTPDKHSRFQAQDALAFKNEFLEQPVVDQAIHDVAKIIETRFPEYKMPKTQSTFELSFDIDAPFAYRGKGWFKNFLGSFKMLSSGLFSQGFNRLFYTLIGGKDPFDEFNYLLLLLDDFDFEAFFFLLLEWKGERNPGVRTNYGGYMSAVDKLSNGHILGIHPSYDAHEAGKLAEEQNRFSKLTGFDPEVSRNHFIRIRFPETYRLLSDAGIKHDYSMGFPEMPGFRAGIARPYPFYDLMSATVNGLIIHPFMFMDATYEYYLPPTSEEGVKEKFMELKRECALYGGRYHIVLHNDLLSGFFSKYHWKGLLTDFLMEQK